MRLLQLALLATFVFTSACSAPKTNNDPNEQVWLDLFNGSDIHDWTVKISGYPAGENAFDTFRVEDGVLQARYDNYQEFGNHFGHIIYNGGPYSHYILQVEYRFVGEQVPGGPAWALRNNGMMYHSQSAAEMGIKQDFPACLEYQLLGGDGQTPRSTANLCTPGTHVVMEGELRTDHCINSSSDTYHGDQWVTAELVVHGSDFAQHSVNGKPVMEYSGLQMDDGTPRASGYIALQAESHPTDFRKVRLLNLEGCMDKNAKNYKSYLVKNSPQSCLY